MRPVRACACVTQNPFVSCIVRFLPSFLTFFLGLVHTGVRISLYVYDARDRVLDPHTIAPVTADDFSAGASSSTSSKGCYWVPLLSFFVTEAHCWRDGIAAENIPASWAESEGEEEGEDKGIGKQWMMLWALPE
jgi:hypothetical protein